jgi:hypothetical protein
MDLGTLLGGMSMGMTDYTPCQQNGEYWYSHAYYIQSHRGQVELYTIDEVHQWCQEYSKKYGVKEIRVEHIIHWEADEEE